MLADLIKSKLNSLNIKWTQVNKEIKCRCLNPKHNDANPSFSINTTTGNFFCFSCGHKGNFKNLLGLEVSEETLRDMKYLEILRELELSERVPEGPIGYQEQLLPPNSELPLPTDGIRGISKELLESLGVYYCIVGKYRGRLIFPVRDTEGNILGFDARIYILPNHPPIEPVNPKAKYLRPTLMKTKDIFYPVDYLQNTYGSVNSVIITEGIFDALSWIALGIPAVCNFGLSAPSTTKVGMLLSIGVTEILNGFDLDVAGINGFQNIKEDFRKYFAIGRPTEDLKAFRKSGFKDANDYLIKLQEEE